jgi:hypothetical protein
MFRYILLERNIDSVQLIFDNCSAFCFFRFVFARPSKSVRIETVKKFDANWIYVKRNLKMFRQDYLTFYRNYFDLPVNMLTINLYWIKCFYQDYQYAATTNHNLYSPLLYHCSIVSLTKQLKDVPSF